MLYCCTILRIHALSLARSPSRSLTHSLAPSLAPSLARPLARALARSPSRSLASLARSLARFLARSLERSLDRSLAPRSPLARSPPSLSRLLAHSPLAERKLSGRPGPPGGSPASRIYVFFSAGCMKTHGWKIISLQFVVLVKPSTT